jgi:hypothetical protein
MTRTRAAEASPTRRSIGASGILNPSHAGTAAGGCSTGRYAPRQMGQGRAASAGERTASSTPRLWAQAPRQWLDVRLHSSATSHRPMPLTRCCELQAQAIRQSPSAAGAIARAPFARRQGILLAAQTLTVSGTASLAGRSGILRCRRATWIARAKSVEKRERPRKNYWNDVCTHVWCGGGPYGTESEIVSSFFI